MLQLANILAIMPQRFAIMIKDMPPIPLGRLLDCVRFTGQIQQQQMNFDINY